MSNPIFLVAKNVSSVQAHIQNATLAGGVAVGAVAECVIHPYGAAIIGASSGILSTIGFVYIQVHPP